MLAHCILVNQATILSIRGEDRGAETQENRGQVIGKERAGSRRSKKAVHIIY